MRVFVLCVRLLAKKNCLICIDRCFCPSLSSNRGKSASRRELFMGIVAKTCA